MLSGALLALERPCSGVGQGWAGGGVLLGRSHEPLPVPGYEEQEPQRACSEMQAGAHTAFPDCNLDSCAQVWIK